MFCALAGVILAACGAGGTDPDAPLPGAVDGSAPTLATPRLVVPPRPTPPPPSSTNARPSDTTVPTTTTENTTCPRNHIVQQGESLTVIAELYAGVSFEDIAELNNLSDANRIFPGSELCIPFPANPEDAGDS